MFKTLLSTVYIHLPASLRLPLGWLRLRLAGRVTVLAVSGALLLTCGIVLRVIGLGKTLWFDEAYSYFIARQPIWQIPSLLHRYDTHPPLYYVLLSFWMAAAGAREVLLRIPSVLTGASVILLTLLFGVRIGGLVVGLIAGGFVAVSPYLIAASQEARMYSLLSALVLGATYALFLATQDGSRRRWTAYGVFMTLAMYTHHFAIVVILAHIVYLVILRQTKLVRRWLRAVLVVTMVYLPLAPTLPGQVATVRSWPSVRPELSFADIVDVFALWSFGGGRFGAATYFQKGSQVALIPETCVLTPLRFTDPAPPRKCEQKPIGPLVALLPMAVLLLAGAGGSPAASRAVLLSYWLVPFVTIVLVSTEWNIFQKRYFTFLTPPFALILASGVARVARNLVGVRFPLALALVVLIPASYTLPALVDYYRTPPTHDWRGAALYIRDHAGPRDALILIPGFVRLPLEYYHPSTQTVISLNPREVSRGGQVVSFELDVDAAMMKSVARRHPRVWLVVAMPVGGEARRSLLRATTGMFREASGRGFGYLGIFRWDSLMFREPEP